MATGSPYCKNSTLVRIAWKVTQIATTIYIEYFAFAIFLLLPQNGAKCWDSNTTTVSAAVKLVSRPGLTGDVNIVAPIWHPGTIIPEFSHYTVLQRRQICDGNCGNHKFNGKDIAITFCCCFC